MTDKELIKMHHFTREANSLDYENTYQINELTSKNFIYCGETQFSESKMSSNGQKSGENYHGELQPHDFSIQLHVQALCDDKKFENMYGCRKCKENTYFSNFVDFLCHNLQQHTECWNFWCNICNITIFTMENMKIHVKLHPINDLVVSQTTDVAENVSSESTNDFSVIQSEKYKLRRMPTRKKRKKLEVIKCNICEKSFLYRSAFKKHMETHSESRILCDNCGTQCSNYKSYKEHKTKGNCGLFTCPQCYKTFSHVSVVKNHFRQQHSSTTQIMKCRYCCQILEAENVDKHNSQHHATETQGKVRELYNCDFCKKAFSNKTVLLRHVVKHINADEKKSFLCMYCGKTFTMDSSLKLHMRIHTKDYRYTCDLCGERFLTKEYLKAHCFKHTGGKRFKCRLCSEAFNHRTTLKNHRESVHLEQLKFKCSTCEDSFETQLGFDRHKRLYGENCAPICKICNKKFHRNVLKRHEFTHTDIKMFACDLCPKRFTRKGNLDQHQNVHTGEKPYKCSQCDEAFHNSTTLFVHRMKHQGRQYQSGVRPKVVQCAICGFQYTSQALLNKHLLKMHSVQNDVDELFQCEDCDYQSTKRANFYAHRWKRHSPSKKQHECNYCGKTFFIKFQLIDHMNKHTGATPHRCPGCSKEFSSRKNMKQHRDKHCPVVTKLKK